LERLGGEDVLANGFYRCFSLGYVAEGGLGFFTNIFVMITIAFLDDGIKSVLWKWR